MDLISLYLLFQSTEMSAHKNSPSHRGNARWVMIISVSIATLILLVCLIAISIWCKRRRPGKRKNTTSVTDSDQLHTRPNPHVTQSPGIFMVEQRPPSVAPSDSMIFEHIYDEPVEAEPSGFFVHFLTALGTYIFER